MQIEMKKLAYNTLFTSMLFLVGCANAGKDQVVNGGSVVILDANNSTASVGGKLTKYKWMQTSGIHVDIDDNTKSKIKFTAPKVDTAIDLKFKLKTVEIGGRPKHFRTYDFVKVTVKASQGVDTTPPVIKLNGDNPMKLKIGETYVEPGAKANDDQDGEVDVNITGEVNTSRAGTYIITYTAKDSANNKATAERNVTVQKENNGTDTTPPVIKLNGDNPMKLKIGETYVELGATALDDQDGEVDVNITGEVNTSTVGTYTVTYTATDRSNNVATAERNVTVQKENNGTDNTGIISISDANVVAPGVAVHKVVMNKSNVSRTYDYKINGSGKSPAQPVIQFLPVPKFDTNSGITISDDYKKITVPAGISSFNIKIGTRGTSPSPTTYTLTLGNKTAIGTIKFKQ